MPFVPVVCEAILDTGTLRLVPKGFGAEVTHQPLSIRWQEIYSLQPVFLGPIWRIGHWLTPLSPEGVLVVAHAGRPTVFFFSTKTEVLTRWAGEQKVTVHSPRRMRLLLARLGRP